ncbi:cytochrome c biogenesis protein CcsA [Micromonospora sonneratiae]
MRVDERTPFTSGSRAPADRRTLGWLAGALGCAALTTGLLIAPADRVQGDAQRLMYLHVPAAWTAFLAFAVVLLASGAYLIWRDLRWDRCARAAAEIGVVLTALTIVLGSLWGRLAWGTWWAWDPRLVSTALLFLVYAGYLTLRHTWSTPDDDRTGARGRPARHDAIAAHRVARPAAILGIVGFVLVPVVHWSVSWWRSLHQQATVLGPEKPPMDLLMGAALALSVLAFSVAAGWLFLRRVATLEDRVLGPAVRTAGPEPAPSPARRGRR